MREKGDNGSQRMELVGQRGYYRMTAINECERRWDMENCTPVWVCFTCVCVSESMKFISPGPSSPVEPLIKSPCWGSVYSDSQVALHLSA